MLTLLPVIFLWLAARWAALRPRDVSLGFDVRDALLIGAVATGAWGFLGAELLSLFHHFDRPFVIGWWTAGIAAIAIVSRKAPLGVLLVNARPARDRINRLLIAVAVLFLIGTGLISFLTPTSTPDCLCYHLPRQIFWIQNHSVAHFPASDLRQLEMPPLAEFISAQLMLLSGNDHQSNLVQWFSYLIGALAASAIARDLGAGARAQTFAAVLALLNPGAATQSVNGKNDLVVALWFMALMWAAVRIWTSRSFPLRYAVFIGISLGLLLLTKGTGFAIAPAVCLVIAIGAFRADWRRAPILGASIVVLAAAITAPHLARNHRAFGYFLSVPFEKGGFDITNTAHTPAVIGSNLLRSLTLHTNTPSAKFNAWQERVVESAHRRMGISSADQSTTPIYLKKFSIVPLWANDGNNPAPVHLVLTAAMVALFRPRRLAGRRAWPIFLIPFVSAVLISALLKFQPSNNRLEIPIVTSVAPLLALWLTRRPGVMVLATLPAAYVAACGLLWNDSKPLVGPHSIIGKSREEIMYLIQLRKGELQHAKEAVDYLATLKPETVALDIQPHTNDYSSMRLLLDHVKPTPVLMVLRPVHGPKPPSPVRPPDAVLGSWDRAGAITTYAPSETYLQCGFISDPFKVYLRGERPADPHFTRVVPPFFGWSSEQGWKPPEGPYPQFDLPVVRWAESLKAHLVFVSDGEPVTLLMEGRRNDSADQVITVYLNQKSVYRYEFGLPWEFIPFRIPIQPVKGPNVLTLDFANINPGPAWAVLFRKLQIVPTSWLETTPGTPEPTRNP